MEKDQLSRKLAVILHADVVGSTTLVQQNEALAHERIQGAFNRFSEFINSYKGITRELRGDAILAEFDRASDAVSAALAFQISNRDFNSTLNDDVQPNLRIGIGLGEVIIADSTVTGEGVVLAQRIEQLAKPGGLCITGAIHEALPQRMPFSQESLGEQLLKGFDEPVRVYQVALSPGESIPPAPEIRQPEATPKSQRLIVVASVIALVITGGTAYWYEPWVTKEEPASIERMAFPLPDKPSIAVLPFANLSDNPEQEFFADGITNDIITDLSKFGDIVVIAANSTFTYKGKPVKVQQVAEELGVRYVVEGSIQKAGNQVRINAQFIDAITGKHLWAERYDRDIKDVFALQDEITQKIVSILGTWTGQVSEVTREGAISKGTADLTAYEHFLIGSNHIQRFTKDDNAKAQDYYSRAIEHDPRYARAYAWMAWTHFFDWQRGWSKSEDVSADRAYEFARKAVELDADEAEAHSALAVVYFLIRKQPEEAITEYERALSLNPNHPDLLADWGGFSMPFLTGNADEGLELVKKAMRLNPSHPDWYEQAFGIAAYVARRYDEAISALRKVKYHGVESQAALAASYAQLGRLEEAQIETAKLLEIQPDFSIELFTEKSYFKNPEDLAHHIDGLRKAGIPETPPLSLPDKPSIAVLPFTNMSDDPNQDYFSDGISEDIITDLSQLKNLAVIARNSSFTYRNTTTKVQDIGKDLGAKYLLEGSVRKAGNQIRITAQLIDAYSGHHLWAERFDRELTEMFALQDEITDRIVSALSIRLSGAEQKQLSRSTTNNFEAYDLFLQGQISGASFTEEGIAEAIQTYRKAINLDSDFARAYGALAVMLTREVNMGFSNSPVETMERSLEMARKAVSIDPDSPQAQWALGYVYMYRKQFDLAVEVLEQAVSLAPSYADGYALLALIKNNLGEAEDAISLIKKGMELNPYYSWDYLYNLGRANYALGRFEEAKNYLLQAMERNQAPGVNRVFLIASLVQLGDLEDAEWEIMQLETSHPQYSLSNLSQVLPITDQVLRDRLNDDLRTAGMAE